MLLCVTQEKTSGMMDKAKDAAASAQDSMQQVHFDFSISHMLYIRFFTE